MTTAYGAFANGGWLRTPVFIRRVEDAQGTVLYTGVSETRRAISEQTAFLMATILADVVNSGTGYRVRQAGFTAPAAGKTGTTNDYRDAWFIGFTPKIVTGVWVGFDDPKTIVPGGYAGELAAPIWGRFMKAAVPAKEAAWIKPPDGIVTMEVCRASGALPTEGCRRALVTDRDGFSVEKNLVGVEYFRHGTEPAMECPIHGWSLTDRFQSILGIGDHRPELPKPPVLNPPTVNPAAVLQKPPASQGAGSSVAPKIAAATPKSVAGPAKKPGLWGRLKNVIVGPDRSKPAPKPKAGAGGS
jgi:penicillin-binding protein 1A